MTLNSSCWPLLLLGAALLLVGCRGGETPPPAARVVLVQPVAAAAAGQAALTGEVRARHEVDLAFRVGGKIVARRVDVGSEIKAGQALASLDPADLQLAVTSTRAQLAAAESELATARTERERYAGLLARKFVSQAAFEARDNAYNTARARFEQASAQSRLSGNQAGYGSLSSEFPAIVTAVLADVGQVVSPGQAVLRVARPEEKEVLVAVPEGRLAEIRAARSFAIRLWATPDTVLRGELRELSPAADPATRTYAARIRLLAPPPEVRLGMSARVSLGLAAEPQFMIPLAAVIDTGQGPFVRLVNAGKVISRPVQVAQFREDGVLIAGGLLAGDHVIVSGASRLVDGEAVQARAVTPPARQR